MLGRVVDGARLLQRHSRRRSRTAFFITAPLHPWLGQGAEAVLVPGAGRFALTSSRTKTQSLESGGVKACVPLFENVPRLVVAPVCGSNHQPLTVLVALVIFVMSTAMVVALPFGMYAMIV